MIVVFAVFLGLALFLLECGGYIRKDTLVISLLLTWILQAILYSL